MNVKNINFKNKNINTSLGIMIMVLLDHYIYLFISKTTGYINKFDKNKIMFLMIKDIQLFKKYNKIWEKI